MKSWYFDSLSLHFGNPDYDFKIKLLNVDMIKIIVFTKIHQEDKVLAV